MRCLIFFMPMLFLSVFSFSQKKNDKASIEKPDAVLQLNMQKHIEAMLLGRLKNNALSMAGYIASTYKKIDLQPIIDSTFLQPYTLDLGKEIKATSSVKINGLALETSIDYWPFPFCPNSFFAGTAVWGAMENNQPFLYDLKPEIEKNNITTPDLLKLIKNKSSELAAKNVSAIIFYNGSDKDDSLKFLASDTTVSTTIPVVYFTKSGIKKLRNESTIANAIDAKIVLGKKIISSTNALAYLNNGAANTVLITALMNNEISTTIIFELAKLLKETCQPTKKNTTGLNPASYNNNNYLFVNFSGNYIDNFGSAYFFEHLPLNIATINYALNIGTTGAATNTADFLAIDGQKSSLAWSTILQNTKQSFIAKQDSALLFNLNMVQFNKARIPNLYLFNPIIENPQKNKVETINKNDINTIHYIMQLISTANGYGNLPFNTNDK